MPTSLLPSYSGAWAAPPRVARDQRGVRRRATARSAINRANVAPSVTTTCAALAGATRNRYASGGQPPQRCSARSVVERRASKIPNQDAIDGARAGY